MKKCPTCEKTFEDSMRFCQVDGTPLVDDAPAFDPYATIVASPGDDAQVVTPESVETAEPVAEREISGPIPAPIAEPDELLDLPDQGDPLKTMYVSDSEMQQALGETHLSEEPNMEIPPAATPEPPSFSVPDVPAPSFGDLSPPPSPFSAGESVADEPAPALPPFEEPETVIQQQMNMPLDSQPPAPVAEWTPPPAPDASVPFQPLPAGSGSLNQTLPIISLVLGVISLCCYISPITGIAALITGYLGMKNVNNDPANYGGKGLAIAGMITGGLFFLVGTAYYVIIILMYAGIIAGSMLQGF